MTSCATENSLSSSLPSSSCESVSNNSPLQPTVAVLPNRNSSCNLKETSHNKENLYVKRGEAKKRKGTLIEEALGAVKTLASQPTSDSAEHFGNFVGARLREMSPISRKRCEYEILKSLANY